MTQKIEAKNRTKVSIFADKENDEYETLSEQIRINIAKGAKVWIPELAEKLKKKYKPENELTEDGLLKRNKQIVRRIHDDWGHGKPWSDGTLTLFMPQEIQNPDHWTTKNPGRQAQ